ncbi:hypothetical protein Tco_0850358 [Tanacetum coccineum]
MTLEDVIREIKYFLNRDPLAEYSPNNDLIYTIPEMFTDEHTLDYSSPPRYDDADDDLFDLKTDNDEWVKILYDDPFDSKENKIKDSKLLVDELDSPRSSSFLIHFLECDSVLYVDFSEVDTLTSTDNEDKVFNPGILVHETLYEVTNRVTPDKNVKKISSSNASLILEDYNPPLSDHELPFHIEILRSGTLLSFLSKNEEKVFNPGILISKRVHSLLPELSHRGSKAFKVISIFESQMEIFPCSYREDIHVLDVPCLHFYPLRTTQFGGWVKLSDLKQALHGIAPDFETSHARGIGYSLKDKNEAKTEKTEHGIGNSCMQTRSLSKFVGEPSTNPTSTIPKRRNRRRSIQRVEPFSLEETPVDTMADQRTMEQLLQAPTEGYGDAIVIPVILA